MEKAGSATPAWRHQAAAALGRARCMSVNQAFAVAGYMHDMPFTAATSIHVVGLPEQLQLPINKQRVADLLSLGEPAPFGLGTETVMDPAVRKATQIEAARVQTNDIWQQQMQQLTARVAKGLGVDEHVHVEAHPYKLLIYTDGGHFKAHRDTKKEPGMFGTLVVQLPVIGGHIGGQFVFRHAGEIISWATEVNSSSHFQYAAFYADVEHELQPITSGTRVVLVYSLVRIGTTVRPKLRDVSPLTQDMRAAVSSWEQALESSSGNTPQHLFVPLAHKYTQASLSYDTLKGRDAKMVSCLTHPDVGLEVHVALMVKTKEYRDDDRYSGSPRNVGYDIEHCVGITGAKRRDLNLREVFKPETAWINSYWLHPSEGCDKQILTTADSDTKAIVEGLDHQSTNQGSGSRFSTSRVYGEDHDVDDWYNDGRHGRESDSDSSEDSEDSDTAAGRKEDECRDVNYTGNMCTTIEKVYREAALVIWPKSRTAGMLGSHGRLYLLELRVLEGAAAHAETALAEVLQQYHEDCDEDAGGRQQSYYCSYAGWIARALMIISKMPLVTAEPAMLAIIQRLSYVGYNKLKREFEDYDDDWYWDDILEIDTELRHAIIDSLIAVGLPDLLVAALVERVKNLASLGTIACARLAVEAAKKSAKLGNAIADALLSQTLLANDAPKVLSSLPDSHVCCLGIMLCELPLQRQHLDAYAAVVATLPVREKPEYVPQDWEPMHVLDMILKNAQVKAAAFHTPSAVATMAAAYQEQLKEKQEPVPEFTWEMPEPFLPELPEVEAFLHGPGMSATFSDCFKDADDVRFLLKVLHRDWWHHGKGPRSKAVMFDQHVTAGGEMSARLTASGLDGVPVVTITKTRHYYQARVDRVKARNQKYEKAMAVATGVLKLCNQAVADMDTAAV